MKKSKNKMTENKRKIIRALLIILAAYIVIKIIMSFKLDNSINTLTESTKLVNTKTVILTNNQIKIPVYGKLNSIDEIDIVSEVNGIFIGKSFKSGLEFKKGDTLGYIKFTEIENNLNSQKSKLLNQVAILVSEIKFDYPESYNTWIDFLSKIEFSKTLPLLPEIKNPKFRNYLSGQNFYTAYFATKATQAKLNKHIIISPFDGVLNNVSIKSGTGIMMGQKIGKLESPLKLEFESNTNIKNTLLVKKNQIVKIKSDEIDGEWAGKVNRVNKSINPSSQNMSVFINVSDKNLFSGMYVYGNILLGENNESYLIKRSLLNDDKIFLIKENKLIEKTIDIVQINEEEVIIKGLKNGDQILSEPIKGSFDGMKVRTTTKK